jgi:predicted metal-dependent hydrolase
MQLGLPFDAEPGRSASDRPRDTLLVGPVPLAVAYVRHRRARHYIIRVQRDGSLRVTIPRGGSRREADRFVGEKQTWIERERSKVLAAGAGARRDAASVTLHGDVLAMVVEQQPAGRVACFGEHRVTVTAGTSVRVAVERHLRSLASGMLPARLAALARPLGRPVSAVTVRAQRTRWGSCSPSGRISLNWRLIQLPPAVADYVLLHELTHLVHLNHSRKFWRELERVCPWQREARAWLRATPADWEL